jgi:PhnB protein
MTFGDRRSASARCLTTLRFVRARSSLGFHGIFAKNTAMSASPESPTSPVKPIPDSYPVISPYLSVRNAGEAIEFYKRAFGATERLRMADPSGRVMHAEIDINGGVIMLTEECEPMSFLSPQHYGGSSAIVHCYVPDVDAFAAKAEAAGATVLRPVATQFYGDRSVSMKDPYGHLWSFATHVEDVSHEELHRRTSAMFANREK